MGTWKTSWDRIPVFVNYLLILAVAGLITLFFPDKLRFKYAYEVGKTWMHDDLYAPFDFAIRKDAQQYEQELLNRLQELKPIYRRLDSIEEKQLRDFSRKFDVQLNMLEPGQFPDLRRNSAAYESYGLRFLRQVFDRGIIVWEGKAAAVPPEIQLVQGNTIRSRKSSQVLTPESARNLVTDSLPYSKLEDAEFLYPILLELIQPNILFDAELNQKLRQEAQEAVSAHKGMVQKGELVIKRGDIVTAPVFQELEGYRLHYEQSLAKKRSSVWLFVGYLCLTLLILGILVAYLWYSHPFVVRQTNHLLLVLLWPLLFSYLVYLIRAENALNPYMLPFAIVPLVLKNFYDGRLALYVHLVVVLLASFLSSMGFAFIFLQLIMGIVIVISRLDTHSWSRFFYSVGLIFLVYSVAYFALALTEEGSLEGIDWRVFSWLLLNSFLVLLAYPLTYLLDRVFGLVSVLRLTELADTNRPLLQLLAQTAPGTFQHSLQVAHLAETAARQIGADSLLVKAGALYHDIGKMNAPGFFIENQAGNNPHEGLEYEDSAQRIIAHVTNGVALARKYGLPRVIADFILTHHGTTRVEYFYRHFLQRNPDADPETELVFRYPGPKPVSKEAAILMMADTIEAAAKSLKTPTAADVDELVDRLIQGKIAMGQLDDSALSFSELQTCKQVFKQMLRSIYHVRVEYPK